MAHLHHTTPVAAPVAAPVVAAPVAGTTFQPAVAHTVTTTTVEDKPTKMHGTKDKLAGAVKEKAGKVLHKPDMAIKGQEQRAHGQQEVDLARAEKGQTTAAGGGILHGKHHGLHAHNAAAPVPIAAAGAPVVATTTAPALAPVTAAHPHSTGEPLIGGKRVVEQKRII